MPDKKNRGKDHDSIQSYLYASDKERLRVLVREMSANAAAAVEKSIRALEERDLKLANKVIEEDDIIDDMEEQIDQECLYSIAMRQPVREDLRFVYSVMKIIVDLERIGDQAVNIAMNVLDLPDGIAFPHEIAAFAQKMAEENISMINDVMTAFLGEDNDILCETRRRRKSVKGMRNSAVLVLDGIISSENAYEKDRIKLFCAAILTLRHLSRISDHVLNLAERVSFIATGISPLTLKRAQEEKGRN